MIHLNIAKMILTIALANTSILSHNYHFLFVVKTLKIYSLCNFQVYDRVFLAVITMLYIRFTELANIITVSLYPSTNISLFPLLGAHDNHHITLFL